MSSTTRAGAAGVSVRVRWLALLIAGVCELGLGQPAAATPTPSATPVPPPPSAIGSYAVLWLAASPAYEHSGFVVAVAQGTACKQACLFATHDGGATWKRASPDGVAVTRAVIGADPGGQETVFANLGDGVGRSADAGATWTRVGSSGLPNIGADYPSTRRVTVGGGTSPDYALKGGTVEPVVGSSGSVADLTFMVAPGYPSGGRYAPVLLSGGDKRAGLPVIEQCTADFVCSGPGATLQDASTFSVPATLLPSSDYAQDGVVFAQTGRGIYKSTDGGVTFTPIHIGLAGATATSTTMMALDPGYREHGADRTAYVAVLQAFHDAAHPKNDRTDGGIYKTTDGGASWAKAGSPSPLDSGASSVAISLDGRLFAGYLGSYGKGLLCSVDGGSTWRATCPVASLHISGAGTGVSNPSGQCHASSCGSPAAAPGSGAGSSAPPGEANGGVQGVNVDAGGPARAGVSPAGSSTPIRLVSIVAAGVVALSVCAVLLRRRFARDATKAATRGAPKHLQ